MLREQPGQSKAAVYPESPGCNKNNFNQKGKKIMKATIFAKKKKTKEGRTFTAYVTRLTNKATGSEVSMAVKFREDCGQPKPEECPMIIEFDKNKANRTERTYTREDTGEDAVAYTLWISEWKKSNEVYVDHSLDDFE